MEKEALEVRCAHCKVYNGIGRVFCIRCRRRLGALTPYDISADDYTYPPDSEKLELLREMEPLPHLVEEMVGRGRERSLRSWLSKNATRVGFESELGESVRSLGEILGLEVLPEVRTVPGEAVTAFTSGSEANPTLAISERALKVLDRGEVAAVIGHELAHIKSKHLLYHVLAESLASGAGFVGSFFGAGIVSAPIQMLLLGWYRESEISADRAALLAVGEMNTLDSLMGKLASYSEAGRGTDTYPSISELFRTHPVFERRRHMLREYHASLAFRRGRAKIERRRNISKALVPLCRFCGAAKPTAKLFCEACGRSQV